MKEDINLQDNTQQTNDPIPFRKKLYSDVNYEYRVSGYDMGLNEQEFYDKLKDNNYKKKVYDILDYKYKIENKKFEDKQTFFNKIDTEFGYSKNKSGEFLKPPTENKKYVGLFDIPQTPDFKKEKEIENKNIDEFISLNENIISSANTLNQYNKLSNDYNEIAKKINEQINLLDKSDPDYNNKKAQIISDNKESVQGLQNIKSEIEKLGLTEQKIYEIRNSKELYNEKLKQISNYKLTPEQLKKLGIPFDNGSKLNKISLLSNVPTNIVNDNIPTSKSVRDKLPTNQQERFNKWKEQTQKNTDLAINNYVKNKALIDKLNETQVNNLLQQTKQSVSQGKLVPIQENGQYDLVKSSNYLDASKKVLLNATIGTVIHFNTLFTGVLSKLIWNTKILENQLKIQEDFNKNLENKFGVSKGAVGAFEQMADLVSLAIPIGAYTKGAAEIGVSTKFGKALKTTKKGTKKFNKIASTIGGTTTFSIDRFANTLENNYQQLINDEALVYGGIEKIPEDRKADVIKKASNDAFISAVAGAPVDIAFFAFHTKEYNNFLKTLSLSVAKASTLGGIQGAALAGLSNIEGGYENKDVLNSFAQSAKDFALIDLGFKISSGILKTGSKVIDNAAKIYMSKVNPKIIESLLKNYNTEMVKNLVETQEVIEDVQQGTNDLVQQVTDNFNKNYLDTKQTEDKLKDIPEEKRTSNVIGIQVGIDNLDKELELNYKAISEIEKQTQEKLKNAPEISKSFIVEDANGAIENINKKIESLSLAKKKAIERQKKYLDLNEDEVIENDLETERKSTEKNTEQAEKQAEKQEIESGLVTEPTDNVGDIITIEPKKNEQAEPPKFEPPKFEPPKFEPPKFEPPKFEPPKFEPPKFEPPKVEPPKVEPPKVEPPKVEPPKVEPPKVEPPKVEPPKVEPPKVEQTEQVKKNSENDVEVELSDEEKERLENAKSKRKKQQDNNETEPQKNRRLGYKIPYGQTRKIERKDKIKNIVYGKETNIHFTKNKKEVGKYAVISANDLVPTHIEGVKNETHFIPELQPRDRSSLDRLKIEAETKAKNLEPDLLMDDNKAYFGAPIINSRGELIQGTGRSEALLKYFNIDKTDSKNYIKKLLEKAKELGLDKNDINKIKNPVLVRVLDVEDNKAIELGQYTTKDLEDIVQKGSINKSKANLISEDIAKNISNYFKNINDLNDTSNSNIRSNAENIINILIKNNIIKAEEKELYINGNGEITKDGIASINEILSNFVLSSSVEDVSKIINKPNLVYFKKLLEKNLNLLVGNENIRKVFQNSIIIANKYQDRKLESFKQFVNSKDLFTNESVSDKFNPADILFTEKILSLETLNQKSEYIKEVYNNLTGLEGLFNIPKMSLEKSILEANKKEYIDKNGEIKYSIEDENSYNELEKEALKYDNVDDFIVNELEKNSKKDYMTSHRPTFYVGEKGDLSVTSPPASNLLQGDMLPRDVYEKPDYSISNGRIYKNDKSAIESFNILKKIKDNPNEYVYIYRASVKNVLNIGDWVTFSKTYAELESRNDTKVYKHKVKAGDIYFAGDDINEFGYFPVQTLKNIYNEAHSKNKKYSIEDEMQNDLNDIYDIVGGKKITESKFETIKKSLGVENITFEEYNEYQEKQEKIKIDEENYKKESEQDNTTISELVNVINENSNGDLKIIVGEVKNKRIGAVAFFDPKTNTITISSKLDPKTKLSKIGHEVTHFLEAFIENVAKTRNNEIAKAILKKRDMVLKELEEYIGKNLTTKEGLEHVRKELGISDKYKGIDLINEIFPKLIERELNKNDTEAKGIFKKMKDIVKDYVQKIKDFIFGLKGFSDIKSVEDLMSLTSQDFIKRFSEETLSGGKNIKDLIKAENDKKKNAENQTLKKLRDEFKDNPRILELFGDKYTHEAWKADDVVDIYNGFLKKSLLGDNIDFIKFRNIIDSLEKTPFEDAKGGFLLGFVKELADHIAKLDKPDVTLENLLKNSTKELKIISNRAGKSLYSFSLFEKLYHLTWGTNENNTELLKRLFNVNTKKQEGIAKESISQVQKLLGVETEESSLLNNEEVKKKDELIQKLRNEIKDLSLEFLKKVKSHYKNIPDEILEEIAENYSNKIKYSLEDLILDVEKKTNIKVDRKKIYNEVKEAKSKKEILDSKLERLKKENEQLKNGILKANKSKKEIKLTEEEQKIQDEIDDLKQTNYLLKRSIQIKKQIDELRKGNLPDKVERIKDLTDEQQEIQDQINEAKKTRSLLTQKIRLEEKERDIDNNIESPKKEKSQLTDEQKELLNQNTIKKRTINLKEKLNKLKKENEDLVNGDYVEKETKKDSEDVELTDEQKNINEDLDEEEIRNLALKVLRKDEIDKAENAINILEKGGAKFTEKQRKKLISELFKIIINSKNGNKQTDIDLLNALNKSLGTNRQVITFEQTNRIREINEKIEVSRKYIQEDLLNNLVKKIGNENLTENEIESLVKDTEKLVKDEIKNVFKLIEEKENIFNKNISFSDFILTLANSSILSTRTIVGNYLEVSSNAVQKNIINVIQNLFKKDKISFSYRKKLFDRVYQFNNILQFLESIKEVESLGDKYVNSIAKIAKNNLELDKRGVYKLGLKDKFINNILSLGILKNGKSLPVFGGYIDLISRGIQGGEKIAVSDAQSRFFLKTISNLGVEKYLKDNSFDIIALKFAFDFKNSYSDLVDYILKNKEDNKKAIELLGLNENNKEKVLKTLINGSIDYIKKETYRNENVITKFLVQQKNSKNYFYKTINLALNLGFKFAKVLSNVADKGLQVNSVLYALSRYYSLNYKISKERLKETNQPLYYLKKQELNSVRNYAIFGSIVRLAGAGLVMGGLAGYDEEQDKVYLNIGDKKSSPIKYEFAMWALQTGIFTQTYVNKDKVDGQTPLMTAISELRVLIPELNFSSIGDKSTLKQIETMAGSSIAADFLKQTKQAVKETYNKFNEVTGVLEKNKIDISGEQKENIFNNIATEVLFNVFLNPTINYAGGSSIKTFTTDYGADAKTQIEKLKKSFNVKNIFNLPRKEKTFKIESENELKNAEMYVFGDKSINFINKISNKLVVKDFLGKIAYFEKIKKTPNFIYNNLIYQGKYKTDNGNNIVFSKEQKNEVDRKFEENLSIMINAVEKNINFVGLNPNNDYEEYNIDDFLEDNKDIISKVRKIEKNSENITSKEFENLVSKIRNKAKTFTENWVKHKYRGKIKEEEKNK